MIEVFILAIALSMDAFAVSIGLGTKQRHRAPSLGLVAGIYFGVFQGVMPLVGYFTGISVFTLIEVVAPWIAFFLLAVVGAKMIYESTREGVEDNIEKLTHKVMLVLAIATSIDAMVAGFSFTLLSVNVFHACLLIAVTTFVFSYLGILIGAKSGSYLESKAELFGGIVLILIGMKFLVV